MDVDSAVDHLAEVRPVPEIARAPINLVDDHTTRIASLQLTDHLGEHGPTDTCRRLPFFVHWATSM